MTASPQPSPWSNAVKCPRWLLNWLWPPEDPPDRLAPAQRSANRASAWAIMEDILFALFH